MKNWTYRFHFVVVERTDEQVIVTLQPTMDAVFILPTTWERGNKGRPLKSGSPVDGRTDLLLLFPFSLSSLVPSFHVGISMGSSHRPLEMLLLLSGLWVNGKCANVDEVSKNWYDGEGPPFSASSMPFLNVNEIRRNNKNEEDVRLPFTFILPLGDIFFVF